MKSGKIFFEVLISVYGIFCLLWTYFTIQAFSSSRPAALSDNLIEFHGSIPIRFYHSIFQINQYLFPILMTFGMMVLYVLPSKKQGKKRPWLIWNCVLFFLNFASIYYYHTR